MRIKFKPYARPELEAWPQFYPSPETQKGNWASAFAQPSNPLCLELGCGKGKFMAVKALEDPSCNYLAVDIKNEMLLLAKRNIVSAYQEANIPLHNIALSAHNIEKISGILAPEDRVSRIYINFCNPWYKVGHAKHRLTHPRQLIQYRDFLIPKGEIWFKTDNLPLFEDSLRYFTHTGFSISWQTFDLHKDEPSWNIRTEHETMYSEQGIPINACIAVMEPANLDKAEFSRMKNI